MTVDHLISVYSSLLFPRTRELRLAGGLLEARWKCRPQCFSALAGNVGSVALVLTINGASLLNRPCQTMQCPAESRDEDMGLQ